VVKKLVEPVHKSVINVTTDNWFTSSKLTADLLCQQITLLGTMRKNKPENPAEFVGARGRAAGSSLFGFCQKQAMVSYVVPKKNKVAVLLSSMHDKKELDRKSGKPLMITDYNKTKGAVDRVSQLQCSETNQALATGVFLQLSQYLRHECTYHLHHKVSRLASEALQQTPQFSGELWSSVGRTVAAEKAPPAKTSKSNTECIENVRIRSTETEVN